VKHARAEHAWVEIRGDDAEVTVIVRDDGSGFETTEPTAGFGLVGMRERVELLDGRLTIESVPREGTRVSATLPLSARA
jgi:two-component system, NarL family, sensor histidine kinase DegS